MDYAISIYKGGKRVYAKDCDFVSYSEQGLICPICKQEVYLRKGNIREPYFAHFHATTSREVEECELRVSADGNGTETSSLIENRGQRLEIFQQHFISLIYFENSKIIEDVKFNNWINSRKDESNQIINDIIIKCIDCFLENRQLMEAKYIIHTTKIKNKQILLQQKISLEVMSYLCDNAKFNYNLRYLLFYSMYQIYQYEKHKLIRQNIKTQDIEKVCQYTVRIIMCNSWILAFKNTKINGVNNKTQQNIIKINKMSTDVKLASSVQKGINTNLMSPLFKLAEFKYQVQLIILDTGEVQLNQFLPDASKMIIDIGFITGIDEHGISQINYNPSFKLVGNKQIHDQLQRLINNAVKTDATFLKTQNREVDNQFQTDRKEKLLAAKRAKYDGRHSAYHVRKKMFKNW
ncbi:competence protein CoiA family protein [Nostoc sp.]|uniref:competence protein CoiA family protein n=1 Tax=Nostoc sp. TaxID=1180 RepID=UPI002FF7F1FF